MLGKAQRACQVEGGVGTSGGPSYSPLVDRPTHLRWALLLTSGGPSYSPLVGPLTHLWWTLLLTSTQRACQVEGGVGTGMRLEENLQEVCTQALTLYLMQRGNARTRTSLATPAPPSLAGVAAPAAASFICTVGGAPLTSSCDKRVQVVGTRHHARTRQARAADTLSGVTARRPAGHACARARCGALRARPFERSRWRCRRQQTPRRRRCRRRSRTRQGAGTDALRKHAHAAQ